MTGLTAAYRALRKPLSRGLTIIKDESGYTADPERIDNHVRTLWARIFDVDKGQMERNAERFAQKYEQYIYTAPEWKLGALTTREVWETITNAPATAAGPDGWLPADLRVCSPQAIRWLTNLYNLVEEGESWPKDIMKARAVALAKTEPPSIDDVFQYRLLLMLPAVYRIWAKARLRALKPWVKEWDVPEICAGIPGKGAESAWYKVALEQEYAEMRLKMRTMAIIDLTKAFDHLPRPLVYKILEMAGMPKRVLRAYRDFQEAL